MRVRAALAAVAVLVAGCTSSGTGGPSATAPASTTPTTPASSALSSDAPPPRHLTDWPTYHGRVDRTGYAPSMPTVTRTPRIVADLKLDGAMYASPVVVGGVVIAASEGDTVYAFDLGGHKKWEQHLGSPATADELPCGNIDPLGITGTPVVANGTVYVAPEYGSPPRHELVALDLDTGAVRWRRSIDLPGVETRAMQERGALTVTGGRVWVPFGGLLGDCGGYKGRVIGVRLDGTGAPIAYTVPTAREAGIWTPPGPSVDAGGNLFVQVGNGASVQGDPYDHSDSVLKISPSAQLLDSFSPSSWASDNAGDLDLGSQGPALVGARWVFAAGKSGTAYVLDQRHLGGIGGEVSQVALCHSYGGTAVVGDVVYVPCTDGDRAVRIDDAGTVHPLWRATDSVNGSPVVGGGRVWTLDPTAGVLHALDLRTGVTREQVQVGETSRFATPALYGRNVLVPTMSGLVIAAT
ncbi:MAG TPA: PQQ-binding-like beta-propeller repeat protein [Jatrophihabitans sp.]|jgi:outer membrane protein assembly factor BamB